MLFVWQGAAVLCLCMLACGVTERKSELSHGICTGQQCSVVACNSFPDVHILISTGAKKEGEINRELKWS